MRENPGGELNSAASDHRRCKKKINHHVFINIKLFEINVFSKSEIFKYVLKPNLSRNIPKNA